MVELTTAPEALDIDPADIFLIRKGDTPGAMRVSAETLLAFFGAGDGGEGGTVAADRRVRYVTLTNFSHYTDGGSISRIRFRRPNGSDLPNPVILHDGVGTGGYPFSNALDNDGSSFFSTYQGQLTGAVVLDFGGLVEIADIAVTNRVDGSFAQSVATFVAYGKKSLILPGVEIATTFFSAAGWNANSVVRYMPLGFVNDINTPVVGFKQYRVYITAGNNPTQVCMGELRCYDAADGGTDVTDIRESIQFSGEAGSNTASNVFDNNDGNGWFDTKPAPNFIGFKLAEPVAVKRITIGLFFQSDYMPRDFKFQGSNDDGLTWTDLLTVEGKTNWAAGQTAFLIP